jgi:hypothetical protein
MRNTCRILVRKPEGKGLLGRPRIKWEDSTDINVKNPLKIGTNN